MKRAKNRIKNENFLAPKNESTSVIRKNKRWKP